MASDGIRWPGRFAGAVESGCRCLKSQSELALYALQALAVGVRGSETASDRNDCWGYDRPVSGLNVRHWWRKGRKDRMVSGC